MQAETLNTLDGDNMRVENGRGFSLRSPNGLQDMTAPFWRIVPVLFGSAAWLPQIATSAASLGKSSARIIDAPIGGGFLQSNIASLLGPDGLTIAGALLAGLIAYSIWALARAIGAPRWACATAASLWVVAPLFGIAPSPAIALDDAAFGAMMTLALAALVWTGRREDSNCLMAAFVLAILAAVLRPGAAWPAIAIGLGALFASNKLEEGPWLGMLSSLCWAPGLYFAHKLIVGDESPAQLSQAVTDPTFADKVREGAQAGAGAMDAANMSLPIIFNGLLSALPFVIFGVVALVGLTIVFLLGKGRRRGAIAGAIGAGVSVLGAAGYGSLDAARLLLDPIFLGLGAAIGLVLPALIKRYQENRAREAATSNTPTTN